MRQPPRTFRDGLVVGLVAYAAVALFYSAFDLLAARHPLFTVDMLGQAMFRGLRDPSVLMFPTRIDAGAVFWYNAFHLLASLAIGLVVTALVDRAQRDPRVAPWAFAAIVAGGVATVLLVGALTTPMRPLLPWWSIVVANLFASLAAGVLLVSRRPGLLQRVARPWHLGGRTGAPPAAAGH